MMDNVHAFQCRDDIIDEAYEWVLLFNADAPVTVDDITALKEWSSRSSVHREALKEVEDFWCEAELLSQLAVPAYQPKRGRLGRIFSELVGMPPLLDGAGSVMFNRSRAFATVLLLGLGITLVLSLMPLRNSVGNGIYSTAVGEQKSITLRDASNVQLDTHSQIRVAYEDGVRQLHLLRGKAHFRVAKNPHRPFEVYAGEGLVRAVGTAFSVYLTDSDIEVVVDEGRVDLARLAVNTEVNSTPSDDGQRATSVGSHSMINALSSNALSSNALSGNTSSSNSSSSAATSRDDAPQDPVVPATRLQPGNVFMSLDRGQRVQFNLARQELVQLSDSDLSNELAWRKGALVFVRDPLSEVISEVGRYTRVKIEIVDPALRDLLMGGRFRVGELDALFDVLEIGFGVQVNYLDEHHVQLRFAPNG